MATPERLSPVRRCLFERATQSETDDYLDEELRRISEHKNATWNFDFKKDQPQPGAWQWERIDVATNATTTDIKPSVGEIAARPDDKAPAPAVVAVTESRPSPRRSDRQRNAREGCDGDETTASRRGTLALSTTVERRRSPRRRKATADAATETTTNNGDIRGEGVIKL